MWTPRFWRSWNWEEGGKGYKHKGTQPGSEFLLGVCSDLPAWETGTNLQPLQTLCQYLLFFTQFSLVSCSPQAIHQTPNLLAFWKAPYLLWLCRKIVSLLWGPPSRSETPRSPSHTSTPSPKHRTPGSAWSPPCRRLSCQDTQTSQLPGHFSLFHSPPSPVFSTPSWRKISAGEQQAWPPKPSGRGSFVPLCTRASRWS